MSTKRILLLGILMTVQPARADWVIITKTQTAGQDQQMTMKIKDNMIRNDIGGSMSVLINGNDGGAQMFIHDTRTVVRMDPEMIKGMGALAGKFMGGDAEPPKIKATGEKVKVGQWDSEVYTWEGKMGSGRFYIAKSFPKFGDLNKAMDKLSKAMANPMSRMFPNNTDFPGMVVKSEMKMMGQVTTSELVSANEQSVSAEDFKAPEGYKEQKMPGLPGGLKPKQR
jgi:Domain of unknown function (DUF4412)